MDAFTMVEGLGVSIAKIPLGIFGLVIVASLLVLLILFLKKYPTEKCADFWLKVLKIIFRYKEEPNERRTD